MPETLEKTDTAASMREQRDRFLAFAFASADLFIEVSEEGRVTQILGAVKGLTGFEDKDFLGKKWLEIFSVYEQARMISVFERAKPGVRCGPMLINMSETMGTRKAVFTAIKMPGSNKFYITLGVSSAMMARIAHALGDQTGAEILSKDTFLEAAQKALERARLSGQGVALTLFDFTPTMMERKRMGEPAWKKLREGLAEFMITECIDGYTAGEISDGRYGFINDKRSAAETLKEKIMGIARQCDPSGQGLNIRVRPISVDLKYLKERETPRAIKYVLDEFAAKGAGVEIPSLNAAYEMFVSTSASKVKELQGVIERAGFSFMFQPVVNTLSTQVIHYEMLCRFDSGDTREWMRLAADAGLESMLDLAVCDRAINHVKFKSGGSYTKFSVHVSAPSAEDTEFRASFIDKLSKHPNIGERLMFEIADAAEIRNVAEAEKLVAALKKIGIRVALDHFHESSGSSDLLVALHPDMVKIDGRHVRSMLSSSRDAAAIKNIIEACRGLQIETVAKWVEDRAQAEALKAMGVDGLQGHYLGKPSSKIEYIPAAF